MSESPVLTPTELFRVDGLHARPTAEQGSAPLDEILRGLDLVVNEGEIHAIMGPNGSGKSTLGNTLLGSPEYEVTSGTITFRGDDVTDWPVDERAKAGMFLAFQYPQEIPGVSVIQFLRQALSARKGVDLSVLELRLATMEWMKRLGIDSSFVDRYLNEGFSGGEKKRNEVMQMAILEPELAILDETDSGLDIDALRVVARGHPRGPGRTPHDGCRHDHPLPTPARRGPARPRAHPGRWPNRRQRWHGAGRAARARRIRVVPSGSLRAGPMAVDWSSVRADFPILRREIDGAPIVYLDSGNTSQKPQQVIEAMDEFQRTSYAPINRSAYRLAAEATDRYEGARAAVARLINAPQADEVVFTKNATEAINLVASSWGGANLRQGDVVLLTHMEHHANIVPWHMLAQTKGIELRWVPLTDDGQLDLTDLDRLLDGASAFSFTAMSNVLGTLHSGRQVVRSRARCRGARDRRCLPVRAAQRDRRPGVGRRLRRLLEPQDVRPFRHRRAVGPGRAARRDAALHRWRQHDRRRAARRLHVCTGPRQVRGRHAADHRGGGFRRRRRVPRIDRHGRGAAPRDGAHPLRDRHPHRALRRRHHDPRPRQRRGSRAAC